MLEIGRHGENSGGGGPSASKIEQRGGDFGSDGIQIPAIHHGSQRLPALNATGAVINNVFVIPLPTLFQRGGWPATAIWRSASGQIVKTINEGPFHP
jgi:hypothetical protein